MAKNAKLFRWLIAVWLVLGCQDQPTDAGRPFPPPPTARVALPTQGPGDVPAVPMPTRHAVPRPWDASDAELVRALQGNGGRAVVAFKNPGSERALETGIRAAVSRRSVESGLALLETQGAEVVARLWFIGAVGVRIDPSVAVALRRHPLVDYIEPEQVRTLDRVPGDGRASAARVLRAGAAVAQTIPWGMYLTQFPAAWSAGNGAGAKVLIIDTGYHRGHPDLPVVGDAHCGGGWGGCDDAFPYPHGTHVTGIAVATNNGTGVIGGAWAVGAQGLFAWGACSSDTGQCFTIPIVEGIQQGVAWGVDVINMSFSSNSPDADEENATWQAWGANIVLVAAAGNTSAEEFRYPAGYTPVMGVSGVDPNGVFAAGSPCPGNPGSTFGLHVDLAAPFWALSTVPPDGYGDEGDDPYWCGTSMATPHVTAAVALMRALVPGLPNYRVEEILFQTADDRGDPEYDTHYGYGVLDAREATWALASPPGVSISGPTYLPPGLACTWTASGLGGVPPYSYAWSGLLNGGGAQITGPVWQSGWLYVTVTDQAGRTGEDSIWIEVDPNAPAPPGCWE